MTSPQPRVPSQAAWYVLWSAMLLLAVGTFAPRPIFSGKWCLIVGLFLAFVAGLQLLLLRGVTFLPRKQASLSAAVLFVFCFAQLIRFEQSKGPPPHIGVDFSAYYLAAELIAKSPSESIYQLPLQPDGRMNLVGEVPRSGSWQAVATRFGSPFAAPYIYPPFCAVLIRPLTLLPFAAALIVWNLTTTVLVIAAVFISLSLSGGRLNAGLALILGVGLFSFYPLAYSLICGQIGGLIFFLLAAGIWLLARDRTWPSALCFALATLIKLTPAMAVPILILHRRWKWLLAYAVCTATLLAFSIWQAGWSAHQQFLHQVLPSISTGVPVTTNSSIVAFVQELFLGYVPIPQTAPPAIPPHSAEVSRVIASLVYCILLLRLYLRRGDQDIIRDLVLVTLMGIVISPVSWTHHYVIALLPFIYLWAKQPSVRNRTLLVLFLVVATDIVAILQFMPAGPMFQLLLSAILPALTVSVAFLALAKEQPSSAQHLSPIAGTE